MSRIEELKQQIAQNPSIPRLDPRLRIPSLRFGTPNSPASVRDILTFIGQTAGINITYDQGLPQLQNPYSIDLADAPLTEALNQVLTANTLTFKVLNPKAIFIYADTQQGRQKWDDVYIQTFYMSHADPAEVNTILNQLVLQGPLVRPLIQPSKTARTLTVRGTLSTLELIAAVIDMADKPLAEVVIDVEILEVDRLRAKQLGLDLANFAVGLVFLPEVTPAGATPPQFNLNSLSQGVRPSDFYMSVPTANIRLLESDQRTRILAKTQLRGREGTALTLQLGDDIPTASAVFNGAQGINNVVPTTIAYRPVGVNVSMTPRVTYQDEIILENLTVDKSALGPSIIVQGQPTPSFTKRTAIVTLRLRDGESNMLAGLIREEDRKIWRTLPGLSNLPVLRNLFGWADNTSDVSDVIMIVTPHILMGHQITAKDLKPLFAGTTNNIGSGTQPPLISPDAPPLPTTVPLTGPLPATGTGTPPAGQATAPPPVTPPPPTLTSPPTGAAAPPRPVGVVPVQPVTGTSTPAPSSGQFVARVGAGDFAMSGGPYPISIQAEGGTAVVGCVNHGDLQPGRPEGGRGQPGQLHAAGERLTDVHSEDRQRGRTHRHRGQPARRQARAAGSGPLAVVMFEPVAPGTSPIGITGSAASVSGPVTLTMVPGTATVRR